MKDYIYIKGARTHNLKNISVKIPRNKLTVITGMSGSGKSSLAFDTIFAEGQRRYVESLSAYARQFLEQMEKPDVDLIEGLSPSVSVEQKAASHNPRSTVGTVTEIYDYLRLLFARIGSPYCYQCGKPIEKQTIHSIVNFLLENANDVRANILAPYVEQKKGEHQKELLHLKQEGYVRIKIDGSLFDLDDHISLNPKQKHTIEVVVDRLRIKKESKSRLYEALEAAFVLGNGVARIDYLDEKRRIINNETLSVNDACVDCGISYPKIQPQMFSFNSPTGACEHCSGLGELMYVDENLVVPNEKISINKGAIVPWFGKKTNYYQSLLEALAKKYRFSLDSPFCKLSDETKDIIFRGSPDLISIQTGRQNYKGFFEGVFSNVMRRYRETESDWMRSELIKFMSYKACPICYGSRLKKESLHIKINGHNIYEMTKTPIDKTKKIIDQLKLNDRQYAIAKPIINEISSRIDFLINVGLSYISLERKSHTLSGGESQRIRLATQIGTALVGVTYVLDEPSVGLHQRDNKKLLDSLKNLKEIGNTVIVVEHDEETIASADHIIDLGPAAGINGGNLIYSGTYEGLLRKKGSITAEYMTHKKTIGLPEFRRPKTERRIKIFGARENNLKNIDVCFPLGCLICITGVSGSGKSTLINETLLPAMQRSLYQSRVRCGRYKEINGAELIDKVINIDQTPIGRTPRSNPATYTGLFTPIRELYAEMTEAKTRGYKPGRFSFNVKGGRCERCNGDGSIRIEMHFLPDVFVCCEECRGKRFNQETLEIKYKGKNINDVLNMSVDEALSFFKNIPNIYKKAITLQDVGLGYIKLGQPANTLSGGEAQRIKLSRELSKRPTGKTLYILDEPTTGLHFEDVKQLLEVISRITAQNNTVIIIEHNLQVIKTADHIIDLGPEGGDEGGYVVAEGTPEEITRCKMSYTGKYLKKAMKRI